jgi:hypothetical protein
LIKPGVVGTLQGVLIVFFLLFVCSGSSNTFYFSGGNFVITNRYNLTSSAIIVLHGSDESDFPSTYINFTRGTSSSQIFYITGAGHIHLERFNFTYSGASGIIRTSSSANASTVNLTSCVIANGGCTHYLMYFFYGGTVRFTSMNIIYLFISVDCRFVAGSNYAEVILYEFDKGTTYFTNTVFEGLVGSSGLANGLIFRCGSSSYTQHLYFTNCNITNCTGLFLKLY